MLQSNIGGEKKKIDLSRFSLETPGVYPYLNLVHKEQKYFIYDGAIGNNRFQYFVVGENSEAGGLCKKYHEKYFQRNEHRINASEEWKEIISIADKDKTIERESGLNAYYMFWRVISQDKKSIMNYAGIPHFEALKEWYEIALMQHLRKISDKILSEEVEQLEIEKWKKGLIKAIEDDYLVLPEDYEPTFTIISTAHAIELNKFREWLISGKDGICEVRSINMLLSENSNISKHILDAYYSIVQQPASIDGLPNGYNGKVNRYYDPYSCSFFGAYLLRDEWLGLNYKMENVSDVMGYFKSYTKAMVYESLERFAKGFQFGFDNFLKDKIDKTTILTFAEEHKPQRIYDFVANPFNKPSLSETTGLGVEKVFSGWYNDGVKAGYYYCAWYLVIENHRMFEPFFFSLTENRKSIDIESAPTSVSGPKSDRIAFDELLSKDKAAFILKMLEDLGITSNGKANISQRKKGSIRGIVEALKDAGILPNKSLECLNSMISTKIGLELKSKVNFSKNCNAFKIKSVEYLKSNYKGQLSI